MKVYFIAIYFLVFCASLPSVFGQTKLPEVMQAFNSTFIEFPFPTNADRQFYIDQKLYAGCSLNGLKVAPNGDMYVSIKRSGKCPVTLAKIQRKPWSPPAPGSTMPPSPASDSYIFEPFPSWELNGGVQKPGSLTPWTSDARNLQSALGIEIDPCNRLWVLDQGVSSGQEGPPNAAKLMVFDLNSPDPKILRTHVFPPDVVDQKLAFLDDVSVDLVNNFVYISDAGIAFNRVVNFNITAALIVYDIANDKSWRLLSQDPSVQPLPNFVGRVSGEDLGTPSKPSRCGVNGIAVSADAQTLYYLALTSVKLYSIPISVLIQSRTKSADEIRAAVKLELADTIGISDGIMCGSDGMLYMTDLTRNAFKRYNPYTGALDILGGSDPRLQWPDGVGFDNNGSIVAFSNQLQHVINGEPVTEQILWRYQLDKKIGSYLDPWAPLCPVSTQLTNPTAASTSPSPSAPLEPPRAFLWWALAATGVSILLGGIIYWMCRRQASNSASSSTSAADPFESYRALH